MNLLEEEDGRGLVNQHDYEESLGIYSQGDDMEPLMDNFIM